MSAASPDEPRSIGSAASAAARLIADGEPLSAVWRYAVLQLLDDYTSTLRHRGAHAAVEMWREAPQGTGDARIDAAFAALAEHCARRDGWPVPAWAVDPTPEAAEWWFVTNLVGLHPRALAESPLSFRKRGVFITSEALLRT